MSFNFTKKDTFIMYKNKYFFDLDSENNLFLSTKPPSTNFPFDLVYSSNDEGILKNKNCFDFDGQIIEIEDNFLSEVSLIEFNKKDFLLFYHVTLSENLDSIRSEGLLPSIGVFSSSFGEETPLVYLFSNLENMEIALSSWMGEVYEDYCEENDLDFDELELSSLYVKIPLSEMNNYLIPSTVGYEVVSDKIIPPHHIHFDKIQ